jgi:Ca2+-binding RTX toxin-like protein
MATYIFDNMTTSDAAAFTSNDQLYFVTESLSDVTVHDIPAGTFTTEAISLTVGSETLLFHADQLSQASAYGNLIFLTSQDALGIGDSANNNIGSYGTAGHNAAVYGFGGNDTIYGSSANDHLYGGDGNDVLNGSSSTTDSGGHYTESDYLNGGAGNDTINGGAGNDHIYGNDQSSTAGAADGNDLITTGNGNNYVNGNAGNDTIDAGNGNNRLYGGAGNDVITVGTGNNYVQGNKGEDTIHGGAGKDTIHGGADNDVLFANSTAGHSGTQLFGDNGDDTLHAGAGFDQLTGGAGNDLFSFEVVGSNSISNLTSAATAAGHDLTTVITDYTVGGDAIHLQFTVSAVDHQSTGVTFTGVDAAYTYAQQLLDSSTGTHGTEVAAIQVGADTFLFYHGAGGTTDTIDSVVKLAGVTASTVTTTDFV